LKFTFEHKVMQLMRGEARLCFAADFFQVMQYEKFNQKQFIRACRAFILKCDSSDILGFGLRNIMMFRFRSFTFAVKINVDIDDKLFFVMTEHELLKLPDVNWVRSTYVKLLDESVSSVDDITLTHVERIYSIIKQHVILRHFGFAEHFKDFDMLNDDFEYYFNALLSWSFKRGITVEL
jgi:hypothetical protein